MIRYIAAHKTESGYKTKRGAEKFIARQDNPEEWWVMVVTNELPEDVVKLEDDRHQRELEQAYRAGKAAERDRLRHILGLEK